MGFAVSAFFGYNLWILKDGVTSYEKARINNVMSECDYNFARCRNILNNDEEMLNVKTDARNLIERIDKAAQKILNVYKPGIIKNLTEILFN